MDTRLFEILNFDGGPVMDRVMMGVTSAWIWIPFYVLALWFVWHERRSSPWRRVLFFMLAWAVTVALADVVCGVFKHTGLLADLFPQIPGRLRPMYTPGLDVHFIREGGLYGTVSGHAATAFSLVTFASLEVRRTWFTIAGVVLALLICYSRIYLGYHFPMDLLYGMLVGLALGFGGYAGYKKLLIFVDSKTNKRNQRE